MDEKDPLRLLIEKKADYEKEIEENKANQAKKTKELNDKITRHIQTRCRCLEIVTVISPDIIHNHVTRYYTSEYDAKDARHKLLEDHIEYNGMIREVYEHEIQYFLNGEFELNDKSPLSEIALIILTERQEHDTKYDRFYIEADTYTMTTTHRNILEMINLWDVFSVSTKKILDEGEMTPTDVSGVLVHIADKVQNYIRVRVSNSNDY